MQCRGIAWSQVIVGGQLAGWGQIDVKGSCSGCLQGAASVHCPVRALGLGCIWGIRIQRRQTIGGGGFGGVGSGGGGLGGGGLGGPTRLEDACGPQSTYSNADKHQSLQQNARLWLCAPPQAHMHLNRDLQTR